MFLPKKILIIGSVWIEPKSSAAGSRLLQIIRFLLSKNFQITFATAAQESNFSFDLESLGVKTAKIELNCDNFNFLVQDLNPNIVIFDRFLSEEQFGWRVAETCPNAVRILDTEDLHFVRRARHKVIKENKDVKVADFYSETAKREIASILRCDLTLIISEFEMNLLINLFGIKAELLFYMPFLLDKLNVSYKIQLHTFSQRENFIFIGNFYHEPNIDAVLELKKNIWPGIKSKLPNAVLKIYGAYPTQQIMELHNPKENFLVLGRVEDALEVISSARVMLAPIRFGAGIKGKLVDAQYCGTPNITTTIGAESMDIGGLWNGFVVDKNIDFIDAAVQLYQDEKIWLKFQTNGFEIYNSRYDKLIFENPFLEKIFYLIENLQNHRKDNFFGSILMHHTALSTKYLSKWIVEKNK